MTSIHPPATTVDSVDLDSLWRTHGPFALRFATVLVGPHDSHDVTVNAFLRVTRSPGWASITNPRAYLARAVANHARDLRRQRTRQWRRDLAAIAPVHVDEHEPAIDLVRHIASLSLQQRAVIFLTYWEDMSEPSVAELLGVSTGTVHRNLTRARAELRKALQ